MQTPAGKAAPAPAASKAPPGKGGHQCEATPPAQKAGGNTKRPFTFNICTNVWPIFHNTIFV